MASNHTDFKVKNGLVVNTTATFLSTTQSISTSTGAVQISGGVGIAGNIYQTGIHVVQNSTSVSTTATGALIVTGGVGIGGGVFVGGSVTATNFFGIFNGTYTGVTTTSTNIAGGTAGQVPYQTAAGATSFFGPGTAGQLLVSSGTSAPVYTNTASIYVGAASSSVNLFGGAAGSMPYQSAANATTLLGIGTNGFVLTSNGTAPVWSALSGLSAGSATTATNIAGGTAGQLHYQIAPGSTGFAGPGTAGQVLVSGGTGAPVYQSTLTLADTSGSTSTTTGALVVAGGVGIGGNLNVGGSNNIIGSSTASQTLYLGAFSATGNTATIYIGSGGSQFPLTNVSIGQNTGGTTTVNGNFTVAGSYIVVGQNTGQVSLNLATGSANTTKTINIGTGGTGTSTNTISIGPTAATGTVVFNTGTNIVINSTTASASTTTGALVVNGGVGIGGALYVGGNAYIGSTVTSGFILGTIPGFNSSYSVVWPTAIGTPSNSNYGLAIGASDVLINSNARITLGANTANTFRVQNGTPSYTAASGQSTVILSGGLGVTGDSFVNGALGIGSTASSVSTTTGALIVAGGAGIGGNLFVGGTTYLSGDLYIDGTQTVINSVLQATQDKTLTLGNTLLQASNNGAGIQIGSTTSPFISWLYDGINSWKSSQAITVTTTATIQGTTNATSTTTGALTVTGGVGIGGNIYLGGNFYSAGNLNIVGVTTITNTASVSSTSTGALQVAGGVGVAGGGYFGGTVTATLFVGTFSGSILGVSTTATNIGGGSPGAIPYQSNTGTTAFVSISTAGYVLQSSGTVPRWVNINPVVLNDISGQFDGSKTVFNLVLDQTIINSIVDSKDLEVVIGGQRLAPYVDTITYPWLTPYDSFKGFRVKSSTSTGQLIVYNAPYRGDTAVLTLRQQTTTRQKRKYPYSATSIAFGD